MQEKHGKKLGKSSFFYFFLIYVRFSALHPKTRLSQLATAL